MFNLHLEKLYKNDYWTTLCEDSQNLINSTLRNGNWNRKSKTCEEVLRLIKYFVVWVPYLNDTKCKSEGRMNMITIISTRISTQTCNGLDYSMNLWRRISLIAMHDSPKDKNSEPFASRIVRRLDQSWPVAVMLAEIIRGGDEPSKWHCLFWSNYLITASHIYM